MPVSRINLKQLIPASQWLRYYDAQSFRADLLSALIVIAMLVPQGMAYAMLAGLPPVMGLYASVFPMLVYALFGGSPTLSIGPVALISMMTYAALSPFYSVGSAAYIEAAMLLALLTGGISVLLGVLRFGFLIQLISHPVIKSFVIASAVLIALGQLKFLFDIPLQGDNLIKFVMSAGQHWSETNIESLLFGLAGLTFLLFTPLLLRRFLPFSGHTLDFMIKSLPLVMVLLSIAVVQFHWIDLQQLKTVGPIPQGFPPLHMPEWSLSMLLQLLPGAFMIAMISFVESLSIAQATALQKRSNLNNNQELIALGLANLSAGISSAFPVTGSLSRTVVNAEAGAKTPMAGVLSSLFIVIVGLFFTSIFTHLPLAILAATILVSIWKLVQFQTFFDTWRYSKADGLAMWITFFAVLLIDLSSGLLLGIISTFILMLWRISRPHVATLGLVEGTQHFRNISRHEVRTSPKIFSMRIDENLNFLNANSIKGYIITEVSQNPELQHVIINCSSISAIDLSALEMLEEVNDELDKLGIQLHLSEVKGPVIDKLNSAEFPQHLSGQIFLSHYLAVQALDPEIYGLQPKVR